MAPAADAAWFYYYLFFLVVLRLDERSFASAVSCLLSNVHCTPHSKVVAFVLFHFVKPNITIAEPSAAGHPGGHPVHCLKKNPKCSFFLLVIIVIVSIFFCYDDVVVAQCCRQVCRHC